MSLPPVSHPGARKSPHLAAALARVRRPDRPVPRTVRIAGRRTSARLEAGFWEALDDICAREGLTLDRLATWLIDQPPSGGDLASRLRLFTVAYYADARIVSALAQAERNGPAGLGG